MTTLNARANQAWDEHLKIRDDAWSSDEKASFEEGWETGYKTAQADEAERVASVLEEAADDLDMPTTVEWLELRDWFKDLLHGVAAVVREEVPS